MKSRRFFVAPCVAVWLLGRAPAFGQTEAALVPMAEQKTPVAPLGEAKWRAIRLKNARPSLVAWQLDARHNARPAFLNVPPAPVSQRQAPESSAQTFPAEMSGWPGIERLSASDEQNLLFVAGDNAQQIEKFRQFVAQLDQPTQSVEIEAQLVALPAAELQQFGLAADAATPGVPGVATPVQGGLRIGFVRGDFQKRLDELAKAGTAKVLSTGPQKIANNTGQAISLLSGPIDNTGTNQNKPLAAPAQGTDTVLTLTPTINADNTITVLMNVATLPATGENSGLTSVVNLRDGDTFAFLGFNPSAFPGAQLNYKVPIYGNIPDVGSLFQSKRATVMFLTARIAHGDKN